MLSAQKPMPESAPANVRESILDTYVLEFLNLAEQFSERNLRKVIISNLKQFILEFGKDSPSFEKNNLVNSKRTPYRIDIDPLLKDIV